MSGPRPDLPRRDELRATAVALFRAAIDAVDPARLVSRYVRRRGANTEIGLDDPAPAALASWRGPTLVVGAGKAAAGMAAACAAALGESAYGEVIAATAGGLSLPHITVTEAGHPLPDERGHSAALRLLELVGGAGAGGILCLISGGASSLLVCPRPPVTLADKIATTQALLACGADIRELNTVRKHLSLVKGGGLLARAQLPVVTLILSDVVGDDPAVIGSGPTMADPTSYADAEGIIARYQLWDQLPASVRDLLRAGVAGRVAESLKPSEPAASLGRSRVIASSATALAAAAQRARALGWDVAVEAEAITGDTSAAARALATRLSRHVGAPRNLCVLAGGETTVQVRGDGRGGRNQEFALAMVEALARSPVCVLSAGSDGIDGPTAAAGAFVDGTTLARARAAALDPQDFLRRNDSHAFFARLDDLFVCGPTGTNVMDLKIILLPAQALQP